MIEEFQGQYRFLSNFWKTPIELDGYHFISVENAYQASKTFKTEWGQFLQCEPGTAKRLGRKVVMRDGWNDHKLMFMANFVHKKFDNPELCNLLLETGHQAIEEGNRWNDKYWGVCLKTGEGENHLGRILMRERTGRRSMR